MVMSCILLLRRLGLLHPTTTGGGNFAIIEALGSIHSTPQPQGGEPLQKGGREVTLYHYEGGGGVKAWNIYDHIWSMYDHIWSI